MPLKYLHTMVRVKDLEKSMAFYELLGPKETRRTDNEGGRFTLVFMALALSSPLLATDPIDVDPDPDYGPITQIVVESMEQVDLETLSPGVYWIVVVHGDGPNETYEIVVT